MGDDVTFTVSSAAPTDGSDQRNQRVEVAEGLTTRRLIEIPADAKLDDVNGWMFTAVTELGQAEAIASLGHTDFVMPATERATVFAHKEHADNRQAILVPTDDPTRAIGHVSVRLPLSDNTHSAEITVVVHPDYRRRGIGAQLAEWAEGVARDAGRTTLHGWVDFGASEAGPQMKGPEGGLMPTSIPGWQFASARGWELQLVTRISALDLPVDPEKLAQFAHEAHTHADGYRIETWIDDLPPLHRGDFAELMRTVSADAPTGGLTITEEKWDEDRVISYFRDAAETGSTQLITGAIHEATGRMVAATVIRVLPESDEAKIGFQWETAVANAHRGHRLGMWVKAINLQRLTELRPDTCRLYTWNAEQNAHMLAINVALGFYPSGGTATLETKA